MKLFNHIGYLVLKIIDMLVYLCVGIFFSIGVILFFDYQKFQAEVNFFCANENSGYVKKFEFNGREYKLLAFCDGEITLQEYNGKPKLKEGEVYL